MAKDWNRYEPTAARTRGNPGRTLRPQSVTIDIHSHIAVPEAAAFVAPHLDLATIPLAHFATPDTKAINQRQNPQVILMTEYGFDRLGSADQAKTLPGVAETDAGKNDRIYRVSEHELMYFGPDTGENILKLSKLIHQ